MKTNLKSNKLICVLLVLAIVLGMFSGVALDITSPTTVFAEDASDLDIASTLTNSLSGKIDGVKGILSYTLSSGNGYTEEAAKSYITSLTNALVSGGYYTSTLTASDVSKCSVGVTFVEESYIPRVDGFADEAHDGEITFIITVTCGEDVVVSDELTYIFTCSVIEVKEVSTADELIEALNESTVSTEIRFMSDITVTGESDDHFLFVEAFSGGTINGNGYTLSFDVDVPDASMCALIYKTSGITTVKDLKVQYVSGKLCNLIWYPINTTLTMDNVEVLDYDSSELVVASYGSSPFFSLSLYSRVTLSNCVNNEQINLATGAGYTAIFMGQYFDTADYHNYSYVTFENCVNNGSLFGENVAFAVGNTSNGQYLYEDQITMIGCVNNGSIIGTTSANIFSELNNSNYSQFNTKYASDSDAFVNNGIITVQSESSISAEITSSGDIIISSESASENVGYYVVMSRAYSSSDAGTSRISINAKYSVEDIESGVADKMKAGILITSDDFAVLTDGMATFEATWSDYKFDDISYEIAVYENNLYYVIDSATMDIQRFGDVGIFGSVSVAAYTAEGVMIGFENISKPSTITVPEFNVKVNGSVYGSLEDAISVAEDGDTIYLLNDITIETPVLITDQKSLTFDGGGHTIDVKVDKDASGASYAESFGAFTAETQYNSANTAGLSALTFKNIVFDLYTDAPAIAVGYYSHLACDLTVDNCEFNLQSEASGTTRAIYSTSLSGLTFTNNTVNGDFRKGIYAVVSQDLEAVGITIANNYFYGVSTLDGGISNSGAITVNLNNAGLDDSIIKIENNYFSDYYKTISVDSFTGIAKSFVVQNNKFVNVDYAFDISTSNDGNKNISLAYNFFDSDGDGVGELMTILQSGDTALTEGGENAGYGDKDSALTSAGIEFMNITLYPYYANSAMTSLVYEAVDGGEEEVKTATDVAVEILGTLTDENTSLDSADIDIATTIITAIDSSTIANDETLLELVAVVEEQAVETNTNLTISSSATVDTEAEIEADYQIATTGGESSETDPTVTGLAISYFGSDVTSASAVVGVEIVQTAGDDGSITLTMTPYVTVGEETVQISNSELTAPITHKIYVGNAVSTSTIKITHTSSETGDVEYYYVPLQSDENGNYVEFTVTHYSTFTFEDYTVTNTSSSSSSSSGSLNIDSSAPTVVQDGDVVTIYDANLYSITVNGVEYVFSGNTVEIDLADLGDGEYEIVAKDFYGRTTEGTFSYQATVVAPTVTETPTATETPVVTETPKVDTNPVTNGGYAIWIILAVIALGVVGFVVYKKKKQ